MEPILPATMTPPTRYVNEVRHFNEPLGKVQQYKSSQEFVNYFDFAIVVVDVHNHHTILKPTNRYKGHNRGFSIRKSYEWNELEVNFNASGLEYDEIKGKAYSTQIKEADQSYETNFLRMLITESNRSITPSHAFGTIEINVNEGTFNKYNRCLFIKELGIVITTLEHADRVIHPLSAEAQVQTLTQDDDPFVFKLFANDPTGVEYAKRYVNLNGSVYPVKILHRPTMAAGVYMTQGIEPHGEEYSAQSLRLKHYSFEEADKQLNLYKTVAEAKDHHGHLSAERQAAMKQREEEFERYKDDMRKDALAREARYATLKQELEIEYRKQMNELKRENDKLRAKAEKRAAKLKKKADRLEEGSMVRKDRYESASYTRKGWGEVIKWVPGIVAGAATAVGIGLALLL